MALLRKRAKVEIEHDAGAYAPGWDVPDQFNFVRDVVEVLGYGPTPVGPDLRRSRGNRRSQDLPRARRGRGPLGSPPPHAARARRSRAHRGREGTGVARGDARRAEERGRGGPVPGHAARTRPCLPHPRLPRASRRRRPVARGRGRGDAPPGGRVRVGAVPRRGARGAPPLHAGRPDGGHERERDGAHPLHVRNDQGPARRRPHARVHVGAALPGGALARRARG